MREFFMQFGKVVDATVMVDRDSSRSKGFGFVTFEDAEGVDKLLQMKGLDIDGKVVRARLCQRSIPRLISLLFVNRRST
jgi:RNA-binding protein Musashi